MTKSQKGIKVSQHNLDDRYGDRHQHRLISVLVNFSAHEQDLAGHLQKEVAPDNVDIL